MKKYTLESYEEQLNHQVIHMDQAVCYCPEYLASRKMHDYPSRKLQLARAVWKEELPLTDYIGEIVYSGIMSRLGERWQNFRENPEDCTDVIFLCRAMLAEKGYKAKCRKDLEKRIKQYGGHAAPAPAWDLPVDPAGNTAILLDDAAAAGYAGSAEKFELYCKEKGLAFANEAEPVFLGFEYFACGMIKEGTKQLKAAVKKMEETGADQVMVLTAQAAWMLRTMTGKLGIEPRFKIRYLAEELEELKADRPAYVYGGSFNLRYLCNADTLNALMKNNKETPDKRAAEFIPLVHGDIRVNKLTIWQRPVGPEYLCFGTDEEILTKIADTAAIDIQKADSDLIVSFEPTAIRPLKELLPEKEVVSYLDLL